jgi:hypothetical protein
MDTLSDDIAGRKGRICKDLGKEKQMQETFERATERHGGKTFLAPGASPIKTVPVELANLVDAHSEENLYLGLIDRAFGSGEELKDVTKTATIIRVIVIVAHATFRPYGLDTHECAEICNQFGSAVVTLNRQLYFFERNPDIFLSGHSCSSSIARDPVG